MGILRRNPIRVQPYFGYRNRDKLIISGRTVRSLPPKFEQAGRWRSFMVMMSQFFARKVADIDVTLCLTRADGADFDYVATSDELGYFRFEIDLEGDWPYPALTAWEVVRLGWQDRDGRNSVIGHVLVPGKDAAIGVISDIDDTIMETGITGGWHNVVRNWKRIFAQMPQERILVEGADVFYGAIGGGVSVPKAEQPTGSFIPATHRPFYYISSSPWQLFSYLLAFQRSRNLPQGVLFLRKWGFNRDTIGEKSHGAHKQKSISAISIISRTCGLPSSSTTRRATCPPLPKRLRASRSASRRCSSGLRKMHSPMSNLTRNGSSSPLGSPCGWETAMRSARIS